MRRSLPRNSCIVRRRPGWRRVCGALSFRLSVTMLLCMSLTITGCFEKNEGEPYYGRGTTPSAQEFRWSDGGLPQTFDPALAAAPPDTDAVRALFEGLTDYDPRTLAPVPGVAMRWESSNDQREWTFYLRRDARWSNGDIVTAGDFVRSWRRTLGLGSRAPHARLFENIVGTGQAVVTASIEQTAGAQQQSRRGNEKNGAVRSSRKDAQTAEPVPDFGVEAVSDDVLRVRLQRPDKDFASLVSHPIFRPVHDVKDDNAGAALAEPIVSNGPFKLTQVASDGVILERAGNYWDAQTVSLNRVRFVAANNAEDALEKYRTGEIDAVTNAGFEPLALKLLAPYKDFRRATFGALTFYGFNTEHVPFGDVRVREALAIAINRERISEDEMDGASEPAMTFLPTRSGDVGSEGSEVAGSVSGDLARAQRLLGEAGYPNGVGFPIVRLLVNRNEQQRQIAQSVAAMWRKALGIETTIIVKSWEEYEVALHDGDYDVVRKGTVMQTMDEAANMRAMFEPHAEAYVVEDPALVPVTSKPATSNGTKQKVAAANAGEGQAASPPARQPILSQAEALKQLPAIPIYFASSYSLVRPYVLGFDNNLLDAPSLKHVRMDTSWQAPKRNTSGWFKFDH